MTWHHERTDDGWQIRDENGLLVATLVDTQHEREADARLIVSASSVDVLVSRAERQLVLRAEHAAELLRRIRAAAANLTTAAHCASLTADARELGELRRDIARCQKHLRDLRTIAGSGF